MIYDSSLHLSFIDTCQSAGRKYVLKTKLVSSSHPCQICLHHFMTCPAESGGRKFCDHHFVNQFFYRTADMPVCSFVI